MSIISYSIVVSVIFNINNHDNNSNEYHDIVVYAVIATHHNHSLVFIINHSITDGILTDDNWDICNVKEPDTCTHVRSRVSYINACFH